MSLYEDKLPETCYAAHTGLNKVVKITKNIMGYEPVLIDVDCDVVKLTKHINNAIDVTSAQSAAMFIGSMFGWDIPAANPDNYDEDGVLKTDLTKDNLYIIDTSDKSNAYHFTIDVTIDDEYIEDVLITAFEGGINYWTDFISRNDYPNEKASNVDIIMAGGILSVFPEDDSMTYSLHKENVIEGIKRMIEEKGMQYLDAGNVDADIADMVIQYAIFQKLVYS